MSRSRLAAAGLILLAAAAGLAARTWWPRPVVIYCDNGSDLAVGVTVDGAEQLRVAPHAIGRLELRTGTHRLAARGGKHDELLVDAAELDGRHEQRLIWNIGGNNRYAVYTMTYGQGAAPPPRVLPGGRLVELPDDVRLEFGQPLPPSVTVTGATATASERAVYHYPLHPDRPCCLAIRAQASQNH